MTTHILSLTYAPKIPLVKSGECTQTIRIHNPEKPKKVGDKLILHPWEGTPYRSRWDWRLETEISEVHLLEFREDGWLADYPWPWIWPHLDGGWPSTVELNEIARMDGIILAEAPRLFKVLAELNGCEQMQNTIWDIIRWPKPKVVE